ncbi:hypothetical protein EMIT07CA2_210031 [Brevibacillus sp. IT-7CA2]
MKKDSRGNLLVFDEIWVNKSFFNKGYDKREFELGKIDNPLGRGDDDVRC